MSKREDFQNKMDENLTLWAARLSTIKIKLSPKTPVEVETPDQKKLADWQAKGEAAVTRLDQLKAMRGDEWDVMKLEMARGWHDLDSLMTQAENAVRAHQDAVSQATDTPVPGPEPATQALPADPQVP